MQYTYVRLALKFLLLTVGSQSKENVAEAKEASAYTESQSEEVSDEIEIMQDVAVDVGNDENVMAYELLHGADADSDYISDFDSDEDANAIFDMIKK